MTENYKRVRCPPCTLGPSVRQQRESSEWKTPFI